MNKTKVNNTVKLNTKLWWVIFAGSIAGLLASFIQTIERINYAKHPVSPLVCDINAVFSCKNVFDAWQSSVFGFTNSLMCIVFFTLIAGVAIAAATGSLVNKKLRLILHFFTIFFLGFGAWYLWQSTYVIGYICIFCLVCYGAVILLNWAFLRVNANDLHISKKFISRGGDTFLWIIWALIITAMIIFKFWL